jgi:hypothetical protein
MRNLQPVVTKRVFLVAPRAPHGCPQCQSANPPHPIYTDGHVLSFTNTREQHHKGLLYRPSTFADVSLLSRIRHIHDKNVTQTEPANKDMRHLRAPLYLAQEVGT